MRMGAERAIDFMITIKVHHEKGNKGFIAIGAVNIGASQIIG